MNRLIIEKYIKGKERVSIPEIQFKFSLSYKETRALFLELENKQVIKPDDDIYYTVLSQQAAEPAVDQDEDVDDKWDIGESRPSFDIVAQRRAEIRKRREELRRRMAETTFLDEDDDDCDDDEDDRENDDDEDDEEVENNQVEEWLFNDEDDDDEADEDEKTVEDILRERFKKLSEENEDDDDEDEDEEDLVLFEPRKITLADIERRRTLAKIATSFGCSGKFVRIGEEYYCSLGVVYPNDVPMTLKLSYKDEIILSDLGITNKYMSSAFDLSDPMVEKVIHDVMEEYNLQWVSQEGALELTKRIRDEDGAFISFLYFFSAIERLCHIPQEKWYKTNATEARCREELLRILFVEEATYEEGLQTAKDLYAQAQAEGDEAKQRVYKRMLEKFEGITAENFEDFKNRILNER